MATVTRSIGATARDHATITLWEADVDTDASAEYSSGDDALGECYNDANFDESVTMNCGAAQSLNSVKLSVEADERHTGLEGTGARILATATRHFRISTPSGFGAKYTVEWLEIDMNGQEGAAVNGEGQTYSNVGILKNCIIHDQDGGFSFAGLVQSSPRDLLVMNNIFYTGPNYIMIICNYYC